MSRDEVLNATKEASKLTQEYIDDSDLRLDLVSIVEDLDIPVLYRPLDNMWGGAITVDERKGILIKSNLPRYLQRFTLAHEIGHLILGHEMQIDDENSVNQWAPKANGRPVEEIAADIFASELLAPVKLIRQNAKRYGWSKSELQDPKKIYQLSLRLGISYEATCWALVDHNIIEREFVKKYKSQNNALKEIKSQALPSLIDHDFRADVWNLSQSDADVQLEADQEDVFVIELDEKSSAGYQWEIKEGNSEIKLVSDDYDIGDKYGSPSSRILCLEITSPGNHKFSFVHKRPWNGSITDKFELLVDNQGREDIGLHRRTKRTVLRRAVA